MRVHVAVVAAVAVVGTAGCSGAGATPATSPSGPPVSTVAVRRMDLSTAQTRPGTLGYGPARVVKVPDGAVTWLPAVGDRVERGKALFRRDDRPVTVFYGATPLFRRLDTVNLAGRDVRVVADNLRALGYRVGPQPPAEHDGAGVLTAQVVEALKRWQKAVGLPANGILDAADVVVLPGPARVNAISAQLGDPAAGGVLSVTGTDKVVTVVVKTAEAATVKPGAAVEVELSSGRRIHGKVARVAAAAEPPDTVEIIVTVDDPAAVGDLDRVQVGVVFAGETRTGVLAVPVGALLALREGGYAVQLAGGSLRAVRTGMFAMGMVEISGEGIGEGTQVVTVS